MTDRSAIPTGAVVAGRYRVLEELGRGGMGTVYLVQHVHTDEKLAMKVLQAAVLADPSALARFQREARATAGIESEHVVRITDADTAPDLDGAPFLVMEYLRGKDLARVLEARGRLSPAEVVGYLRQAAHAVDRAHALGIVHRDLKPDNLFLTERSDGTPCIKVLDFGIAKLGRDVTGVGTQTGAVLGTPAFMAPEQARGGSAVTSAADVWAVGLIAYRLLTGTHYWTAKDTVQLLAQLLYEPMPPPSSRSHGLGPGFDAWFATACSREPERRFRSVGEAVTALATALGVEPRWSTGGDPRWTPPPVGPGASAPPAPSLGAPPLPAIYPPAYAATASTGGSGFGNAPNVAAAPSGVFASSGCKIALAIASAICALGACAIGGVVLGRIGKDGEQSSNAPAQPAPRHDRAPSPSPAPAPAPGPPAPPGLNQLGLDNFKVFLTHPRHKVFVISDQGHYGWRSGRSTVEEARVEAMKFCLGAGARSCKVYMIDDTLVR